MKVKIVADKANCVVHTSNNPDFGYIKLEQVVPTYKNGWFKNEKRTALIHGNIQDLIDMNFVAGQELPGRIVIKESLIPFDSKNSQRHLKIAGDTSVVCCVDDEPIYRNMYYTADENEQDVFIQHTNTDQIRQVVEETKNKQMVTQ